MQRIRALVVLATLGLLAGCGQQPPAPVVFGHRPAPMPQAVEFRGASPQAGAAAMQAPPAAASESVTVQAGDTIYSLARRHNRPVRALIDDNNLQPPYVLQPGQRLRLPGGRFHAVQRGETLYSISRSYGVDLYSMAQSNDLQPPYTISVGQQLRIPSQSGYAVASAPSAAQPAPAAAPRGFQVESLPPPPGATSPGAGQGPQQEQPASSSLPPVPQQPAEQAAPQPLPEANVPARGQTVPQAETADPQVASAPPASAPPASVPPAAEPAAPQQEAVLPPRSGRTFSWPVRGRILSTFGPKPDGLHNDGINIAARAGAPVIAAENGVVVYAGSELKGFGNLLLVRHADGWMTAYAHLDKMLVKKGQKVTRGQAIGTVGSTGGVSQPQLHFEIRKGTQAVDPGKFLSVA
ncbi:MAG: peptidoglycan DD-metalloendopeptidase family protein [Ferrovibrio sp.]|uniref:peptidoglycan DD-metalloendopeptidase family protein n=1 Tax=Ferrovibrio sp. TaxID=1917215 RepID=UPI00391CCDFE